MNSKTSNTETHRSNISTESNREHRSNDTSQPSQRANATNSNGFNVYAIYHTFIAALREPNNRKSSIGTQDYIDGYRELLKFFDHLGYVFKFVKDDVVEKLGILQTFVDKDKGDTIHFNTIQNGINYELEHNLIKANPLNFSRTLLRLHRALLFIIQFLHGLNDRPISESTATIAAHCYDSTLYHHHGFFVRSSVKIGFRMLPTRKQLDDVIFHGKKAEYLDQYKIFMRTIEQIYDTIEAFYEEKKLLQLP